MKLKCQYCDFLMPGFIMNQCDYYSCPACQAEFMYEANSTKLIKQSFKGSIDVKLFYIELDYKDKKSKFSYIDYANGGKADDMVVVDTIISVTPQTAAKKIKTYLPYI